MAISNAVGQERISNVVGYVLQKGFFQDETPNLPLVAPFHFAVKVTTPTTFAAVEITSAQEAGQLYGFGSPIHQIMRILRPNLGGGIGGIPTVVYAQAEAGGAAAATKVITVTGPATGNAIHKVIIAGRNNIDGDSYSIDIVDTDSVTAIAAKIVDVVNGALSSPVTAANVVGVVTLTAKWKGATSEDITVSVDTGGVPVGVAYGVAAGVAGVGTTDISGALDQFGATWNTIVINSYGDPKHAALEAFNGRPDPVTPTGRYVGIVFKPFIALWGSILDTKASILAITDTAGKKIEVTNVLCPAPKSPAMPYEAAANAAVLAARIMQDTPHLDVQGLQYPDMPAPSDGVIGDMSDYNNRDLLVKGGASTVELIAGRYEFRDFVTTYHPDGETPPQFRYARNLMLDFNVRFGYFILEAINVENHSIADNDQPLDVKQVIKPKQWNQIINAYADDLAARNLIIDPPFMQDSIVVGTGGTNPDRLETAFEYKRSAYVRIASTTAKAGFAFGLED